MKNSIKIMTVAALTGILVIPAFVFAHVHVEGQGEGGGVVNISAPSLEGQGEGGGAPAAFSPTVEGFGVGGGDGEISPPTTDGQNTGGGSPSGGSSVVISGGSGGSSVPLPILTNIGDCRYLTTYLKYGAANPISEVLKLQNFLRTYENMDIAATGIFDAPTFAAVSAFQKKYAQDILAPWGARLSTGFVYITTTKKINELYCKRNFTLTPAQVREIEAYRTRKSNDFILDKDYAPDMSPRVGSNSDSIEISDSTETSVDTGSLATDPSATSSDDQVAAASRTPVVTKIWDFIKRIFGR